jgi:hypothetical protein
VLGVAGDMLSMNYDGRGGRKDTSKVGARSLDVDTPPIGLAESMRERGVR